MGISKHINCDGDLKVILSGVSVLSGSGRWTLCLYVGDTFCCGLPSRYVSCGFDGTTYRNCRVLDGGDIECWFRRPNLGCGRLRYKLYVGVSDADFSPDLRSDVYPGDTGYDVGNYPSSDITPGIDFTVLYGLLYPGIRYDTAQTLSIEDQNQALENIGAELMIIDLVNGQAVLTEEQEARLLSCKGVILRGTINAGKEALTKIYFSDYQGGDQVSFWAVRNNRYILQCLYTKSTKLFRFFTSAGYVDPDAVSIKEQTLTTEQQERARKNIRALGQQDSTIYDIVNLAWTTDAATTRKLIPAANRKNGLKISYRNASKVYIVEQYQSEDISDFAWVNDANWKGCRTPLTPIFEGIGAIFNDVTGWYEYNTILDLTESDMIEIYRVTFNFGYLVGNVPALWFCNSKIRTIRSDAHRVQAYSFGSASLAQICDSCKELEVFSVGATVSAGNISYGFRDCPKLTDCGLWDFGYINSADSVKNMLNGCVSLRNINIKRLKVDFSFKFSPLISYESLKFIIDNSTNTSAITITVHPTTYSYLTGTAEPTEQVGGTTEEWQTLVALAQEKQISFVSA